MQTLARRREVMNALEIVDQLLKDGTCHSVFVGKSAMPGRNCFATLVTGSAMTIATGGGNTAHDALTDALRKLPRATAAMPAAPAETRPAMPGFNRNAMPGFGG
jgi:hypothetical protein